MRVIEDCFNELGEVRARYWPLSAVDRAIRYLLEERNGQIGALITFNPRDFNDVCKRFNIELIC